MKVMINLESLHVIRELIAIGQLEGALLALDRLLDEDFRVGRRAAQQRNFALLQEGKITQADYLANREELRRLHPEVELF